MRKCLSIFLTAILAIVLLASCNDKTDEPAPLPTPSPHVPPSPAVTPSPTATPVPSGLMEELRELWGNIDGSTATIPLTAALHELLGADGTRPPQHNTTPDAYWNLINGATTGTCDLIFVTHPSEDELETARLGGVELEVIPIVKDALVFLVNVENPVESITLSQLRDIYSGAITNWSALGGLDEDIIPYQRTRNSGSQTLFMKLLMNEAPPMHPPSEWVAESMGALIETVSTYDNAQAAIGFSMFYFVNNMFGNSQFSLLGIDGVRPTRDSIMRGEYPLEDHYYAVIRKDMPEDHPARKLIDWLLSDDGQALAVRAGYIPLRPMDNIQPGDTIDPIYLGDTGNSSGTGGTALKTDVDDAQPVGGVRRPLSDMFFDGFNYIQYINATIIADFGRKTDPDDWGMPTLGERYLLRPFTGIPNDYPNFEVPRMGVMIISFPNNNPFFDAFGRGMDFYIPLTEDISPYGVGLPELSKTFSYARRLIPQVDLFTVSIEIRGKPDVTARINEQLAAWTDAFPGDGESAELLHGFSEWYIDFMLDGQAGDDWAYRLQPSVETWRDYLSISYVLQLYDGPAANMPMAYTICFDMNTGYAVNLVDALPGDVYHVFTYTRADFSDLSDWGVPNQESMPDGYTPVDGSVITDAWVLYEIVMVYITEPDGRVLQSSLKIED